ncbi:MAG: MMPL family transporter, partial [Polyangiaceae bacterium]|nr:MMPL family transporter [Polyangiaceae bacterium]
MNQSSSPHRSVRVALAYVSFCLKAPWLVLGVLALVTLGFGLGMRGLSLDTRIDALLPLGTPTQVANTEATKRFAGISRFYMVITSSDPDVNRQVIAESFPEVQKWPETVAAIRARDPDFFLKRRLLYLDTETLENFADEVEGYVEHKKCAKMPGCVLLEEDDEVSEPDFQALRDSFAEKPEMKSLASIFGKSGLEGAAGDLPDEKGKEKKEIQHPKGWVAGELCSEDGKTCVIEATLSQEPADLEFSRQMVERAEALMQSKLPDNAPDDVKIAATGIYRNLPKMRDQVMDDLKRTFGIGIALVVLVLVIQFRRFRALILLLLPQTLGSIWALGLMAIFSPELNVISAAGLIILAGLGID